MRALVAVVAAAALVQTGCIALPIPHWQERELGSSLEARDRRLYVVGFVSVWPEINTEYVVVLNHDPKLRTRVEYDPPGGANSTALSEDAGPIYYRRAGGPGVEAALSPTGRKALIYDRAKARAILFELTDRRISELETIPDGARVWGVIWSEDERSVEYNVQVLDNGTGRYPERVANTSYEAKLENGAWVTRATGAETRDVKDATKATAAAPASAFNRPAEGTPQ